MLLVSAPLLLTSLLLPSRIARCSPLSQRRRAIVSSTALGDAPEALTPCGGVSKTIVREASADATSPEWGALVSVLYTGRFENGTVFESKHAESPFEFQLNAGIVVDGMQKGVASMRVGERALVRCEPRWAYGEAGLFDKIPPNATLTYEVELASWRAGPPVVDESFDMETYRASLEGRPAAGGRTTTYAWSETGEEVALWLPLAEGQGARDVKCDFASRDLRVTLGGAVVLEGALHVGGHSSKAIHSSFGEVYSRRRALFAGAAARRPTTATGSSTRRASSRPPRCRSCWLRRARSQSGTECSPPMAHLMALSLLETAGCPHRTEPRRTGDRRERA